MDRFVPKAEVAINNLYEAASHTVIRSYGHTVKSH